MRVFDFDNTIYDGESVIDFYLFSLRRNPKVARYVPVVLYHLLRYCSCTVRKQATENKR